MTDWSIVLWADARQVAEQAGLQPALWPATGTAPQAYFESLRDDGRGDLAALVMASSLPRHEAIAWVTRALPDPPEDDPDYRSRRLILDAARRWVDEPDDINRRAIYALAETADTQWPETLLGLAIFFSGGSITPEDLDPVTADPAVSAHLAAAALQTAAIERLPADEGVLARALDLGNQVAIRGREALTRS
ncbi:DUF6931 family protein [Tsuneonella sp. SYSU-LHT278]|uniref:DUF6931 family protein n=1 Tax=Tsuneonella sediminis TaxID=3416089 RepID=UPI003F7ADD5D